MKIARLQYNYAIFCNNHKISITTTPQRICITINLLAFYLTIKRMNRRDIYIYPSCQNHFRELSISVATNLILMLLPSHYGSHDHQLKMLYNYGLHFNTDNQIDRVLATLKIIFSYYKLCV